MRNLTALLAGLVFGLGLMMSDMANPARVLAFLDVLAIPEGTWDPTLMFVMGGAMAVSSVAWMISRRRATAAWGGPLPAAPSPRIDARLLGGSAIFGAGWGLAGICPGPGFVALGLGGLEIALFVASMLAGMLAYGLMDRALSGAPARA